MMWPQSIDLCNINTINYIFRDSKYEQKVDNNRMNEMITKSSKSQNICLAGLLLFALASVLLSCSREQAFDDAILSVDEEGLNLGLLPEQPDFSKKLKIKNNGQETLHVTLEKSCDCTTMSPKELDIEPKSTGEIDLIFDLTKSTFPNQKSTDGLFTARIVGKINESNQQRKTIRHEWVFRGNVRRVFSLSNKYLAIGNNFDPNTNVAIIDPISPIAGIKVTCDRELGQVRTKEYLDEGNVKYKIFLNLTQDPTDKVYDSYINIEAIAKDGSTSKDKIKVEGVIQQALWMSPQEIVLGTRLLGTSHQEVITLNSIVQGLVVSRIETSSKLVTAKPMTDITAANEKYQVTLKIDKVGPIQESIKFHIVTGDGELRTLNLPVLAIGVSSP